MGRQHRHPALRPPLLHNRRRPIHNHHKQRQTCENPLPRTRKMLPHAHRLLLPLRLRIKHGTNLLPHKPNRLQRLRPPQMLQKHDGIHPARKHQRQTHLPHEHRRPLQRTAPATRTLLLRSQNDRRQPRRPHLIRLLPLRPPRNRLHPLPPLPQTRRKRNRRQLLRLRKHPRQKIQIRSRNDNRQLYRRNHPLRIRTTPHKIRTHCSANK